MFIRVALEYDIISGYVANVSLMSISTAKEYIYRLEFLPKTGTTYQLMNLSNK